MSLEGTLYVKGPEMFWREVACTLDQVYPHTLFSSHKADGQVLYVLNVSYPVGPVYTQISVLDQYSFSGTWYPWNEAQPYSYCPEDGQWVF